MKKRITERRGAVSEPVPAPAPVTTPYEKIAAQLITAINDAVAQIPGFQDDLSGIPKRLRRPVSTEFLGLTVAALDASSELQGVDQLNMTDCRDTLQFSQAMQPLIDQLVGVARRLELIKRVREAKAGTGALGIYHIAQRVALNPNNTHVAVHVENLRAELQRSRFGGKRKAKVLPPLIAKAPVAAAEGGDTTQIAA
jgi:hypothetical protein